MNSIERIETKELRGRILAVLDYNYPAGLSEKLVLQSPNNRVVKVNSRSIPVVQ